MIGLALALYPWDWRQRYEAEYRELLAETGVTAAVLVDLVRGAVAAHRHHERLSGHRLPVGEGVGAFAVGLVAWFIVVGGWSDIFKQSTFLLEWVLVQLAAGTFVALAAFLWVHRLRLIAAVTVGVSGLLLIWQWGGLGAVPGWRSSVFPLQVAMVWFAAVPAILLALAVRAGWAEHRQPRIEPDTTGA